MTEKTPVKVAVLSLLIIISYCYGSGVKAFDYLGMISQITCSKTWDQWRIEVIALKKEIPSYVKALTDSAAEAKLDLKERDLISITVFLPSALEPKIKGFGLYLDCAELHDKLLSTPNLTAFDDWKTCVEAGYGRDPLPEFFGFLFSCYARLLD
jgi:hypothetical protein